MPPKINLRQEEVFDARTLRPLDNAIEIVPGTSPNHDRVIDESILKYLQKFSNSTPRNDNAQLKLAISCVTFTQFKLPTKMKLLHLLELFDKRDLGIWTNNPGLPWTELGYTTNNAIQSNPHAIQSVRRFWHELKNGETIEFPDCCVCAGGNPSEKNAHNVSVDWVYPATITFGEAVFALPLIEGYKEILENYVGLDFVNFDETVPTWLIDIAFTILVLNINFCHWQNYGIPDASKMFRMYCSVQDYFINTKISLPDGSRLKKNSGIPGGSLFTPLIRTICNAIVTFYIFLKIMSKPASITLSSGDDLESLMRRANLSDMVQAWRCAQELGMSLNVEKFKLKWSLMIPELQKLWVKAIKNELKKWE